MLVNNNIENKKIRVAIIGTGQIGFDLLHKLIKFDYVTIVAFVGRRKSTKELPYNVLFSETSINFFISNPNCCDVVFDCTDAASAKINNDVFFEQKIIVIDLTPSNIGKVYIPTITFINKDCLNINMVTCGGQASLPLLYYLHNKMKDITYAEIITQISSESAGMATRINIDKYIETTESAVYNLIGIEKCKVILNVNPHKNSTMQTTIYLKSSSIETDLDINELNAFVNEIKGYIQNYNIEKPTWIEPNVLMIHVNIIGSGDYISTKFGNLDIINCVAIKALKQIYTVWCQD